MLNTKDDRMAPPQNLIVDFETRSELDLKQHGSYEYAKHLTTEILCVAWKLDHNPTKVWTPAIASPYGELIQSLLNPNINLVAHNAFFEQVITRFVLPRIVNRPDLANIPIRRWTCTASLAAAVALPRSLEGACQAMKMPVQKDMDGRRLVLKYCKPRTPTKNNPSRWFTDMADLKRLMEYCKTDVGATAGLYAALPALHPVERKVWELDQEINWRGVCVDRELVGKVLAMVTEETEALEKELYKETRGLVSSANQRAKLLDFINHDLKTEAPILPDLKSQTVAHAIEDPKFERAKRLLEIRRDVCRTSTAKYKAFESVSRTDGRARDLLLYHGASTGRWTGRNVQPQNFPRGSIKDMEIACEVLATGDLELVRLIYGNPMETFASCLRGMIRATP